MNLHVEMKKERSSKIQKSIFFQTVFFFYLVIDKGSKLTGCIVLVSNSKSKRGEFGDPIQSKPL